MSGAAELQNAEIWPPRRGFVWAVAVDSTARPYNLSALSIAGETPDAANLRRREVDVWMQAETNDVYFYFDSATSNDLDNTASQAATPAAATYATTYGAVLKAGNPPIKFRLNRALDNFVIVKAASTAGVLRMWAASEST